MDVVLSLFSKAKFVDGAAMPHCQTTETIHLRECLNFSDHNSLGFLFWDRAQIHSCLNEVYRTEMFARRD